MVVAATVDGALITLHPDGPLDANAAASLREAAVRALDEGRSRFVVNLQKTAWADSVGLEGLVELARRITDASGSLALVGANAVMTDILRATRLDQRLALFGSTEEAMRSMRDL